MAKKEPLKNEIEEALENKPILKEPIGGISAYSLPCMYASAT